MRGIAVIGAGQTGLLIAHALLQKGYQVRLFSDKSPQAFLDDARPTGGAVRFEPALQWERELGLNHWDQLAPPMEGVYLTFWPGAPAYPLLTMKGRLAHHGLGIDLRLQSHRWMHDFVERGGQLEIENVTIKRLESIAADHDLTIVAAGRGPIRNLFKRDEARSRYNKPQRLLTLAAVVGAEMRLPGVPFIGTKLNVFAEHGECIISPWYQKDGKHCWVLAIEAKKGGLLDRFDDVRTGEQMVEASKKVIFDVTPQHRDWLKDVELVDDNAWLLGSFTPEVRKTVGHLPSGRAVMALGDTNHSLDPVAAQGANNGNKMARNLVRCIEERGDEPFDAAWMQDTFDQFWAQHHLANELTNTLLEPLKPAAIQMFLAAHGSTGRLDDDSPNQRAANQMAENFANPNGATAAFHDAKLARDWVEQATGSRYMPIIQSAARIAMAQLRMRLGLSSGQPGLVRLRTA